MLHIQVCRLKTCETHQLITHIILVCHNTENGGEIILSKNSVNDSADRTCLPVHKLTKFQKATVNQKHSGQLVTLSSQARLLQDYYYIMQGWKIELCIQNTRTDRIKFLSIMMASSLGCFC